MLLAASDVVEDAQKKFVRKDAAGGIVFMNLAALSFPDMAFEDEFRPDFTAWADDVERATPGLKLVVVMGYECVPRSARRGWRPSVPKHARRRRGSLKRAKPR